MHHRICFVLVVAATFAASPATAQVGFGAHYARAADAFNGTTGIGARLTLSAPLVPVSGAANAEYFFTDCDECGLSGATFEANFHLPLPFLRPWAGVGYAIRRVEVAGVTNTRKGYTAGVGAELSFLRIKPFVELRYEFIDAPEHQVFTRIGLTYR
jgi:hypothetical protein